MKILITGSRGNIGKNLMPYLQNKGYEVYGIGSTAWIEDNYRMVDINNAIELSEVFHNFQPDVCYHLAAKTGRLLCEKSPSAAIGTNVMGTNNIIQLCLFYHVRLIYFSTCEAYGDTTGLHTEDRELKPNNIYGLSKVLGEQLVKYYITCGLGAIIVRPFMLYHESEQTGDHHSALIIFCDKLIRKQKITAYIGNKRGWTYLDDAVQIFELLLHTEGNYTINIGSPNIYSISELAQMICDKIGINYDDYVIEKQMPKQTSYTREPDLRKQTELTGFTNFTSLSTGLDRVINKMLCK